MKKNWKEPQLEILNINETMAGTIYNSFDGDFCDDQPIPTNESGQPLIGHS